jgi:hypothetical protein
MACQSSGERSGSGLSSCSGAVLRARVIVHSRAGVLRGRVLVAASSSGLARVDALAVDMAGAERVACRTGVGRCPFFSPGLASLRHLSSLPHSPPPHQQKQNVGRGHLRRRRRHRPRHDLLVSARSRQSGGRGGPLTMRARALAAASASGRTTVWRSSPMTVRAPRAGAGFAGLNAPSCRGQPHHAVLRRLFLRGAPDRRRGQEPGGDEPQKHRVRRQAPHRTPLRVSIRVSGLPEALLTERSVQ